MGGRFRRMARAFATAAYTAISRAHDDSVVLGMVSLRAPRSPLLEDGPVFPRASLPGDFCAQHLTPLGVVTASITHFCRRAYGARSFLAGTHSHSLSEWSGEEQNSRTTLDRSSRLIGLVSTATG
jgi:hypothetical protein